MIRIFIGTMLVSLVACGSSSGPRAVKHRFPTKPIATVPVAQKSGVLDAQRARDAAAEEEAHAAALYDEAKSDKGVAKNELKQADIEVKSAKSELKAAEATANMNDVAAANEKLKAAEAAQRKARSKLSYLEAYADYLRKQKTWASYEIVAQDARVELERAKVARARNIDAKGAKPLATYESEYKSRADEAQRKRNAAAGAKKTAEKAKKTWQGTGKKTGKAAE